VQTPPSTYHLQATESIWLNVPAKDILNHYIQPFKKPENLKRKEK
jgi:hypothetical protein